MTTAVTVLIGLMSVWSITRAQQTYDGTLNPVIPDWEPQGTIVDDECGILFPFSLNAKWHSDASGMDYYFGLDWGIAVNPFASGKRTREYRLPSETSYPNTAYPGRRAKLADTRVTISCHEAIHPDGTRTKFIRFLLIKGKLTESPGEPLNLEELEITEEDYSAPTPTETWCFFLDTWQGDVLISHEIIPGACWTVEKT